MGGRAPPPTAMYSEIRADGRSVPFESLHSGGAGVRVVLADYGAGTSAASARRSRAPGPSRSSRPIPARFATRRSPSIAGVGHAGAALPPGSRRAALDEALRERAARARPLLGICVGMQLLFEESDEGGAGLGLLAGPVERLAGAPRPAHGLERARASSGDVPLLDGLDGEDVYFAHSYAARPAEPSCRAPRSTTAARSSPRSSGRARRRPVPSRAQRRRPARGCSRTCWHGQEARDPLPRRRGRPRRQGRPLREPARHGRSRRARHPLLGARRGRARLPRHHGHARRPRAAASSCRAGGRGAADPVHGRRRRPGRSRRRGRCSARARTRSRSTGLRSTSRSC